MKKLKPFRQTPGLCGPASLKILLSHYGKDFTEVELAKLCNATTEHGVDHAGLVTAVEAIGEKPLTKTNASIDVLRSYVEKDVPVIVGWYSQHGTPDYHYSVVYAVDDETISLMNPELDEGSETMSIEEFEKLWYDFEGTEDSRTDRWMLAIPAFGA